MTREDQFITWLIPILMSATLGFVGWIAINISKISENLAVVAYKVEAQTSAIHDAELRIRVLEKYASIRKRAFDNNP